jgi:hypothetical protein
LKKLFALLFSGAAAICVAQFVSFNDQPFLSALPNASFQLTNISQLILWIDISQATNTAHAGAPTNGDKIDKITLDLSPRNNTTVANGSEIYYVSTGGGGDGSKPYLAMTNTANRGVGTSAALTNATTFTVGMVWKAVAEGDTGPMWSDQNSATGAGASGYVKFGSSATDNLGNDDSYNIMNGADLEAPASSRSTAWQVMFWVSNGASSSIWRNSTNLASGTVGTSSGLNLSAFYFGGASYTGVHYTKIHFCRGLVWGKALTSNEIWQASERCKSDFNFPP